MDPFSIIKQVHAFHCVINNLAYHSMHYKHVLFSFTSLLRISHFNINQKSKETGTPTKLLVYSYICLFSTHALPGTKACAICLFLNEFET